mmetsp:Transcript_43650/g.70196  ORF Transcript_43650/g.70196 Transcript_43650/m.70196 type:complete len:224 (+) Transcript_43650:307-978(+)
MALGRDLVDAQRLDVPRGVQHLGRARAGVQAHHLCPVPELVVRPEQLDVRVVERHEATVRAEDEPRRRFPQPRRRRRGVSVLHARLLRRWLPLWHHSGDRLLAGRLDLDRRLARQGLVHRWERVDGLEQPLPLFAVELGAVVERHRHQPRVRVHRHQRQPVLPLHAVSGEVYSQRRLRELGWDLLRGQLHLPRAVGIAVQAQVLLVRVALLVEIIHRAGECLD